MSAIEVTVLGAGVIGLSTALKLQERGHRVTIVAECIPGDPKTIQYTSPWAGAHHVSQAGNDVRQQRIEKETFDTMWAMSAVPETEECFLRIPQTEYYGQLNEVNTLEMKLLEEMPDFRYLTEEEVKIVPHALAGITFTTVTIDTPVYLAYLVKQFIERGGTLVRQTLGHIQDVFALKSSDATGTFRPPAAVVICAGIGARTLGGVQDDDVFPVRGQTVLLRAPWVRFGKTITLDDGPASRTYILPRRSGDVIVGGTRDANDWDPTPRPDTTNSILQRALSLVPELAPPHVLEPSVDDLKPLIIELGCGLRPARRGGIRLEKGILLSGEVKVPVVYNYGHGGYGYQSSWGSASMAADLLDEVFHELQK